MPRDLNRILADLPEKRREGIDARYKELKRQVEGLAELRRVAGRLQGEVPEALDIRQPSVSKLENQADVLLSTLRGYVEAIGGQLQLVVTFPGQPAILLLLQAEDEAPPRARPAPVRNAARTAKKRSTPQGARRT